MPGALFQELAGQRTDTAELAMPVCVFFTGQHRVALQEPGAFGNGEHGIPRRVRRLIGYQK